MDSKFRAHILGGVILFVLCLSAPLAAQSVSDRSVTVIDSTITAAITDELFPGAVVVVGRSDTVLYAEGFGEYAWFNDTRQPDPEWSLWDIASLSKVVATASAAAVLVDSGKLDLDTPVQRFLPRFLGENKSSVTVRMLLNHTSGLPAWVPLRSGSDDRAGALTVLYETDLRWRPGSVAIYSDLNAILAALVIEAVSGEPFDEFTTANVFTATGMNGSRWTPGPADRLRSVPSERRRDGSPLVGTVHDPNAQFLGGVAGHAGVFSTGLDLAHFAQKWLRGVSARDSSWVSPATLRSFLVRSPESGTRALGWDTPRPRDEIADGGTSLYGGCTTTSTFGHTGFTGTMVWFDTAADLFVVLLTNRSYDPPRRSFESIRYVRAQVSDAARGMAGENCS